MGGGGRGMRVVARAGRAAGRRSLARPGARPAPPSAAPTSSSRSSSSAPGTSRCSCSATSTATSSTSSSATARCSAATRRSSRSPRRRTSTRPLAQAISATPPCAVGRAVALDNAGTVEFLLDADTGAFYFIEVNPRIQVEHTVTEEVTGFDIVKAQILIAQGAPLADPEIGLAPQADDPHARLRDAVPRDDRGPGQQLHPRLRPAHRLPLGQRHGHPPRRRHRLLRRGHHALLRFAAGEGDRPGADASSTPPARMDRAPAGVPRPRREDQHPVPRSTWSTHPAFLRRRTARPASSTRRPALFQFPPRQDRATKLLRYIAEVIVNGHPRGAPADPEPGPLPEPPLPPLDRAARTPPGTRDQLHELGPEKLRPLDARAEAAAAHRHDHPRRPPVAAGHAHAHLRHAGRSRRSTRHELAGLFSLEMWGGATFDTSMRFLQGDPWERLAELRERIPNILFQMLLRAANAVGYTNYPDNVVRALRQGGGRRRASTCSASSTRSTGCRTCAWPSTPCARAGALLRGGHLLHRRHPRPGAAQVQPAATTSTWPRSWRQLGAHILAIKDMAGLCKPYAARLLVQALQAGNRHADPLPHARHGRRPAAASILAGRRGGRRHRRRRHRPDVRA